MDCTEALGLIGPVIDGEVEQEKLNDFYEHLRNCEVCRKEYQQQKALKVLVKKKAEKLKAPQSLVEKIKQQTSQELYKNADKASASHAETLLNDNQQKHNQTKPGKYIKQNLSRFLFLEPFESNVNSFFAVILGVCVLAMLVFAGFVKKNSLSFAELQHQFFSTQKEKGNLITWIASSLESSTYNGIHPERLNNQNLLKDFLSKKNAIPVVHDYKMISIQEIVIDSMPTVHIMYIHNEKPKNILKVFVCPLAHINSDILDSDIVQILNHQGSYLYHTTDNKSIYLWKSENMLYSAIASNYKMNLETAIRP